MQPTPCPYMCSQTDRSGSPHGGSEPVVRVGPCRLVADGAPVDPADAVDVLHAFERGLSSFAHMRSVVRVSAVSVRVSLRRTHGIGGLWRLIIRVDRLC